MPPKTITETIQLVTNDIQHYARLNDNQKAIEQIAEAALTAFGSNIEYAPATIKSNRKCAMLAVQSYGRAIKHLPAELQTDIHIIRAALKSDAAAYEFLPKELRADCALAIETVKRNALMLEFVPINTIFQNDYLFEQGINNENTPLPFFLHNTLYVNKCTVRDPATIYLQFQHEEHKKLTVQILVDNFSQKEIFSSFKRAFKEDTSALRQALNDFNLQPNNQAAY